MLKRGGDMIEKLSLSDKDFEYVTKGIAFGVAGGIIVGAIVGNVSLIFSFGGVIGIISGLSYSTYKKIKRQ